VTGSPGAASAIVLAGGRSRRFGSDKLLAGLDGIPLLHHALRAVASTCAEVIVVLASEGPVPAFPGDVEPRIRVVRDESDWPGPLAALVSGARAATGARSLVVAGDMPTLQPVLLRRLLRWERGVGACLLVDHEPQVLPLALDRDVAAAEGGRVLAGGDRSLRTLVAGLELELIEEVEWRLLDPDGMSLHDIDRPEDLERAT
jgi:molybdopterin-guanine dinucleotide biosynthesis protein A